jgi:starvation-inducible outer membrane lipoprotein
MKYLLLSVLALSLTACNSLPTFLGGTSTELENLIAVTAAGTYIVTVTKDGKTLTVQTYECTQANGKLTGCHKRQ